MPPVIFIAGPTATGKSQLALGLAQTFAGEVVNADSRQVYRCMDIGTAKPSPHERGPVPHHLFDLRNPDEGFDLATFLGLARSAIDDITKRGSIPIVAGGTGQYVWALVEGWQVPHVAPDPSLRRDLEAEARRRGPGALHQRLMATDPEAAARIHPHNLRRVIRALEVCQYRQEPGKHLRSKSTPPFDPLVIGLTMDREALYRRIDRRVEGMIERGLLEEVRRLLAMGYPEDLPAFSSAGYREMVLHLQGQLSLEEAVQRTKLATHRLARRQYTWFRMADPRIHWLDAGSDPLPAAEAIARSFLAEKDGYDTMSPDGG